MMKTLKELHNKATEIVERYFTGVTGGKVISVTVCTLINTANSVHFSANYFIQLNGKNIFGNNTGKSFDEVIDNLTNKCEFDRSNFLSELKNKPDIDIVIGC